MNNFVDELKALLEKYDATIDWTCSACSDLHGVYDERMTVSSNNEILLNIEGSCISAYEIKLNQE